jgi:hypothetical protein
MSGDFAAGLLQHKCSMPQFGAAQASGLQAIEITLNIVRKQRRSSDESGVSQHKCGGNGAA